MDDDAFDDMLFGALSSISSSQESLTAVTDEFDRILETAGASQTAQFPSDDDLFTNFHANNLQPVPGEEKKIVKSMQTIPLRCQDTSPKSPETPLAVRDRDWVIKKIELIFESIVDALLEKKDKISISLKTRSGTSGRGIDLANGIVTSKLGLQTREIAFPGRTAQEAWRFTVLVRILELVHDALTSDIVITKRDIYYRSPDLFVKQAVVDRYVDDLACTFGVSRNLLNVSAAAKGLIVGNFDIRKSGGTTLSGSANREGTLIPNLDPSEVLVVSAVRWIVIIEKEATFRSVVHSDLWTNIASQGVILTAKGYPDLATRMFLRELTTIAPHIPLYAMMDFDPDGLAILSTYKHGSYSLAHENVLAGNSTTIWPLNLPHMHWVGVKSHQLISSTARGDSMLEKAAEQAEGLLKLTTRDRRKARKMLEWDVLAEYGPEPEWRSEMQKMLMLNVKAEMQILEERPGGSGHWLKRQLGLG